MRDKILAIVVIILLIVIGIFWFQKRAAEKQVFEAQQEVRKSIIAKDSLQKISDGHYQKLVADTLTQSQLKKITQEIIDLKNRKPISVTTTIVKPVQIVKDTDNIDVKEDSVFIEDYYPRKEYYFLKYTNRLSLKTKKGISDFNFSPIKLTQVVTKKDNGLYQVDFKGPHFFEVESLDIQTEPILEPKKDNWGTLIGIEYGKNLDTKNNIFEINAYQRYKKFYIGGAVSNDNNLKAGIKFEF